MRYGVEIEAENLPEPFDVGDGKYVEDGSLRNYGVEYVSDVLADSDSAKSWHDFVIANLIDNGAEFTKRCGIHIHVDVTGFSIPKLNSFVENYLLLERHIFDIVGHDRATNTFCLPLLDHDGDSSILSRVLTGEAPIRLLSSTSKYTALNFIPITTQNSIEFRMLQTTEDVKIFHQVVDIIEDINSLTKQELLSKYDLLPEDVLEAEAYYENLTHPTSSLEEMKYMEKHFNYKEPEKIQLTYAEIEQYILQNLQ